MRFLDRCKIWVQGGRGGNGCVAFCRERYMPRGRPSGGNGGDGGNVVFVSDASGVTLIDYMYQQHFVSERGKHGKGNNCHGASGKDVILSVPVGTDILDVNEDKVLFTFDKPGLQYIAVTGGKGGVGNFSFCGSRRRLKRNMINPEWIAGQDGEQQWLWLVLKVLADVGILGLPNSGKSTMLSVVSNAKPKIDDYPFTTLKPVLGTLKRGFDEFVIADIPGIIEGASKGKGLGFNFLRHLERCNILVILLDITSADVVGDYDVVKHEIKTYGCGLSDKSSIIALSKCELVSDDVVKNTSDLLYQYTKKGIYPISSITCYGIDNLINVVADKVLEYR